MNGRDRFLAALARYAPDRVPVWELIINEPTLSAFGATDGLDFAEAADLDAVTVFEVMHRTPLAAAEAREFTLRGGAAAGGVALARDEWGIVWGAAADGEDYPVAGPIRGPDVLRRYRPPDPDAPHRLGMLVEAVRRFKGRRAVVFLTHDGFEFAHYLRGGMEGLFEDWIERPTFALELADLVCDWKIRLMLRAIAAGADAVVSGDDYAGGMGPMMSPAHFRMFVAPFLKRTVAAAHAAGVPFIKHTDGQLWPILEDLVATGIDALDPIEPKAGMDIGAVRRRLGHRVTLIGNLDCSHLLARGTPAEVADAVRETIAKAAPDGGYILASSNTIHPGVSPENYRAMLAAAREHGAYPIDPALIRDWAGRDYMARWRT